MTRNPSPGRFEGCGVVVTGAASGIGAATARRFAAEGAFVALLDKDDATPVVRTLPNGRALAVRVDISHRGEAERAIARAAHWMERLDVLVNCAGYPVTTPSETMTEEVWRAHFEADVHGTHFLSEAARPHLERRGGAIVNVGSVAGLGGDRAMEAYNAAKGAELRLTNAMAIDLGPRGVRVNAVCPTLTHTGMSRDVEARSDLMRRLRARIPLGRIGGAEEVASAIAFLASDEASFITGAVLPVDGGISAGSGQPPLL
ncbi:meso-butanediol dehydrogenase / (S,S)-butanediol dehydrogenase / diacetyl reductase [Lutimaribacter pacificus]|uniref:Meso-butanediol dehydrogenase / (S,S)-butanediol dehydrogenase / diacetyl reductase n=1 Tax=Lutimaribacter pacificus TaxID=391948 RepID=A0A1H0LUN8_9RHOB|nr:SDR family oxidoreductase [Lutimaribacter pacificus]SDO71949.1 meso-butanediol dehydrogenase / (S,S)-butanediol dehydrogenase / diacetyl reductase [Lutimaribacter pacificus]SHK02966.1 meso-butanediol dehydrogenase / (S,S)-butanediol dehydrogenase / diacetyl reductase [Lutimaribacter pacificus]